LKALSSPL